MRGFVHCGCGLYYSCGTFHTGLSTPTTRGRRRQQRLRPVCLARLSAGAGVQNSGDIVVSEAMFTNDTVAREGAVAYAVNEPVPAIAADELTDFLYAVRGGALQGNAGEWLEGPLSLKPFVGGVD